MVNTSIEQDRSPGRSEQTTLLAEKRRHHTAFSYARLVLVSLFIGLWVLLFALRMPMPTGFLLVLVAEVFTLVAYIRITVRVKDARTLQRWHYSFLCAEVVFHTAIVYYLGGISWLGPVAYMYALLYASSFLTWRQAAAFTASLVAAFVTLTLLDASGVIPHQWFLPQGPDRFQDPRFVTTTMVAFVGVLSTVAFWMVFMGNEVRRQGDEALQANTQLRATEAELRLLNEELERKVMERTEALARRAEHDQLTGLLNRGAVTRRCQELLALAKRGERPLALVVADADRFKSCNDEGGHQYGDRVLQILAQALREGCRESDVVGRMGGDEFLILLPDTSIQGAMQFCRRVVKPVDEWRHKHSEDGLPMPALSFGVAVFPNHGAEMEELIRIADQAMYAAKRAGGGRWKLGSSSANIEEAHSEGQPKAEPVAPTLD